MVLTGVLASIAGSRSAVATEVVDEAVQVLYYPHPMLHRWPLSSTRA